ncbi:MAG: EF-hand domain-containing protein [Leptolyngbyaceae bacterium]|nr:EF-hand domain-containing protein [Leptolyngbyaceae bacterium]
MTDTPGMTLTSQEFDEICKQNFEKVDSNSSGLIDLTEFTQLIKDMAHILRITPALEDEVGTLFARLDADKSGQISLEEFQVLVRELLTKQGWQIVG